MKNTPVRYDGEDGVEPRIVEAEIVEDNNVSRSFFRPFLARVALSLILGALGIALIVAGSVLTVTIIGAPLGIPLAIMGFLICVVAFFSFFARGSVSLNISNPRR